MPSMNISLTPELLQLVQGKVASGLYNNASEVIREAIRQLDTNAQLLYELKLERLRQALTEGFAQAERGEGEPYTLQQLLTALGRTT